MTSIAFIGLGNMGGPMARNLLKAGVELKAFDLVPEARDSIAAHGAHVAANISEAATNVDVVITMLPAGNHVRDVYLGDDGVLAKAGNDTLCIDCSTIDVATAREVISVATAQGTLMVDAPVSGGVLAAETGTLTFMVGGSEEAFRAARSWLQKMGKNIFHAGAAGNGQAAKICNNMLLAISMIGTSEAFVLADKLGLDRQKLFDIASTASGQCWSLTSYCPVPGPLPSSPANREYRPGFSAAMMLKDLKLAHEAAQSEGAATPLGDHALELYQAFADAGHAGLDFSGIFTMLQKS